MKTSVESQSDAMNVTFGAFFQEKAQEAQNDCSYRPDWTPSLCVIGAIGKTKFFTTFKASVGCAEYKIWRRKRVSRRELDLKDIFALEVIRVAEVIDQAVPLGGS